MAAAALTALQPWPLKLLADHVLGEVPTQPAVDWLLRTLSLGSGPQSVLWVVVLGVLALFASSSLLDAIVTWGWTYAGRRMV